MLAAHRRAHGFNLPVDVFGAGEDLGAIKARMWTIIGLS